MGVPDAPMPTGELRIRAERMGARTVVADAYRTAPFHLGLPSDRADNGSVELIIQGVGPGYLPGDHLAIDVTVGEGASLAVRGQGATKLYPSAQGVPAVIDVTLTVAPGGWLVYLPGALIPYQHAVLEQATSIDVAQGGNLALGEILTPGRLAMGERDLYTRLHLDVEAAFVGHPCLIERARLDPKRRPLTSGGRHGSHSIAGSLYLIGESWTLPDSPAIPETVIWSSATGDGYILVRLLGPTAQAVSETIGTLIV